MKSVLISNVFWLSTHGLEGELPSKGNWFQSFPVILRDTQHK